MNTTASLLVWFLLVASHPTTAVAANLSTPSTESAAPRAAQNSKPPEASAASERLAARGEDLDFLIKELTARHPNAFSQRPRELFIADADALRTRMGAMDDTQFMIALSVLVASLGDSHTSIGKVLGRYPLQVAFFDDGPRLLVAPKASEQWLGARLVAIGDTPMDDVMKRLASIDACETPTALRARARNMIVAPEILYGLGLAEPRQARFVVEGDDGAHHDLALQALDKDAKVAWATLPPGGDMVRMRDAKRGALLLPVDDGKSLYLAYRRCVIDPEAPIGELMKSLLERIDRDAPRRVIIDLRSNGGGNSALLSEWLPELAKRSKERERGWLAVLIDRHTFSSGIMNAWQLQRQCNAVLYGEATGGAKNHFGEVRTFTLPRSGLTVQHSTKYFKLDDEGTGPVTPDVPVVETFANYRAGRDAALEAALTSPRE